MDKIVEKFTAGLSGASIEIDSEEFVFHYKNILRPNSQQVYFLPVDREYFSFIALGFCEATGIGSLEHWETWIYGKLAVFKCFQTEALEALGNILKPILLSQLAGNDGVSRAYDLQHLNNGKLREITIQSTSTNPPLYVFNSTKRDWGYTDVVVFVNTLYEDKGTQVAMIGWGEWQNIQPHLLDSGKPGVRLAPYAELERVGVVKKMVKLMEDEVEE